MLCVKPHILETKNVGLYTCRGGGRGYEKVYCLYTHENVDIFGWPLTYIPTKLYILDVTNPPLIHPVNVQIQFSQCFDQVGDPILFLAALPA